MRENCSALYPNELFAQSVTDYADEYSLQLDKEVCTHHEWVLATQKQACCIMPLFQARFLTWMARSMAAQRVLDIGSSVGFSLAMWAHAVDRRGGVTGLECSSKLAKTARERLTKLSRKNVNILEGDASSLLSSLRADKPYDIIFISAQKSACPAYFQTILDKSRPGNRSRLLRSGGLIIADNTIRPEQAVQMTEFSPAPYMEFGQTESQAQSDMEQLGSFARVMHANRRIEAIFMPLFEGLVMGRLID